MEKVNRVQSAEYRFLLLKIDTAFKHSPYNLYSELRTLYSYRTPQFSG